MKQVCERATITRNGYSWVLENGALKAILTFESGSIKLVSFVNKLADADYVNSDDPGYLFYFDCEGTDFYSDDGGWTLGEAAEHAIEQYGRTWGEELVLTLTRTQGRRMQVRAVFQIYDEDAGIRMQCWLKNLGDECLRISESDLMGWKLANRPCDIHYVENSLTWKMTRGKLANGKRNAVVVYDTGDGWVLTPENNYSTSLQPGAYTGTSAHPFLKIDLWEDGETVKVSTDPLALQAVIRPNEELEYLAVNIEVFQGDVWDARLAAAKHLRRRYKFHDPSRILSVNDWFFRAKRTEAYYRDVMVPALVEMGFDKLLIDDLWNTPTRDDTDVVAALSQDLPKFAAWIREQGLGIGYWFALTGDEWGLGRDLADPAQIDFKRRQMEEVLIGQYLSSWQQIDLGELWKTDTPTAYSHPSDSVYRKWLGVRSYMNHIAHQYPSFLMQTTCELENPVVTDQSVGLMHLPDNGIAGLFWGGVRTYQKDDKNYDHYHPVRNLFGYFGLFPSEGMLDFWNTRTWRGTVAQFYSFLAGRHISIYDDPGEFDAPTRYRLKRFNEWRNNARIKSVLNEIVLPIPRASIGTVNDDTDIHSWMFRSQDRSQALMIVLDERNDAFSSFSQPVRWLSEHKRYLVQDITLSDEGQFQYHFIGLFDGAELRANGLEVDERIQTTGVRAYWFQERNECLKQVVYADDRIHSYEEAMDDDTLSLNVHGTSDARGQLMVYNGANREVQVIDVEWDAPGQTDGPISKIHSKELRV